MDWIASNWDQVQAYNFGTGITGIVMLILAASGLRRLSVMGRALACVFIGIGAYMSYRGFYWFTAAVLAPDGLAYHPAFTSNPADPADWRWTIWLFIVPLELALFRLYFHVFDSTRRLGLVLMIAITLAYIFAGFA